MGVWKMIKEKDRRKAEQHEELMEAQQEQLQSQEQNSQQELQAHLRQSQRLNKTTYHLPDQSDAQQTIHGIRFPWEATLVATIGALSEVVDAMFMNTTLNQLTNGSLGTLQAILISAIVGAGCFFSMAFVGFQQGNRRYYSRKGEMISYVLWAAAGAALVVAKVMAGLVDAGLGHKPIGELLSHQNFISNVIIAIVQGILYVCTGFMTRDSIRILTDNDLREYFLARRKYKKLLDELSDQRQDIVEDISKLKAYHKYAKRLYKSKKAVKKNIAQYNESARALIEARMAIAVEPDLMEEMYDSAMVKEGRSTKKKA